MLACVRSAAVFGIDANPVSIEVDITFGLPGLTIVGLPDASVRESRDRIRSAVRNSGYEFPRHRIIVNLAPADVRKAGSAFDLPIALGVLAAAGVISRRDVDDVLILGELSLDGTIQATRGVLPIAAPRAGGGFADSCCQSQTATRPPWSKGSTSTLCVRCATLSRPSTIHIPIVLRRDGPAAAGGCRRLSEVRGRIAARRALEIAAAGGHNVLLAGPAGFGQDDDGQACRRHPPAAWVRGGPGGDVHPLRRRPPSAGRRAHQGPAVPRASSHRIRRGAGRWRLHSSTREISLAHNGVLFLDEMPEFSRHALEVSVSRSRMASYASRGPSGRRSFLRGSC